MQDDRPPEKTKFKTPLIEWLLVFTILCTLASVFIPAVDMTRNKAGESRLFDYLPLNLGEYVFTILVFAGPPLFALMLHLIRSSMPLSIQERFPWWIPRKEAQEQNRYFKLPPLKVDARPPLYSFSIAAVGSLLLFISACHFHRETFINGSHLVTYVGPLGRNAPQVGVIGICLSIVAIVVGGYVSIRYTSQRNWLTNVSCFLGFLNLVLCFVFWHTIYGE